ncbi:glycosyltransferase family 1 protein, partial [Streptomyces sp. NPDC057540]
MLSPLDTDPGSVTVLHAVQPGDGGVARVVVDLVRFQRAAGLRVAVACPPGTALSAAVRPPPTPTPHPTRRPGPPPPRP